MNTIFYAFDRTYWRPDYYVVSDYRGIDEYSEFLDDMPVRYQFLGDGSEDFWKNPHRENILRFHQHYEFSFNKSPKFSDDFSLRSYMGGTVTYTCMQLAAYMGFTEIYLLGVDFSYGRNKSGQKYTHFHEEKKLTATGFSQYDGASYEVAEAYTKKHGIKIYNATRGGYLEVFERINFDNCKCLKRWRSAFPCNSCYTDENHITKGVKPEWEMENRNQPLHSQRYPVL